MRPGLPFLITLVASTSAFAQPRSAAKVPMRAVPCFPQDAKLDTDGNDAMVCWDKGCMKLDFLATTATWIVKPRTPSQWTSPRAEVKADQVCLGTTCKKLGKKLVAAIGEYKTNQSQDPANVVRLQATTDLKAVVVGDVAWNVAGDSKLKFSTPKLYARTGEKPTVSGIEVANDLMVVHWTACAGPCTKFAIVDSGGRAKGPEGEGGGEVIQLDAKRFVVVSEYAEISVFDLKTAKARGVIRTGAGPEQNWTIRADDSTLYSLFTKNDGVEVMKVGIYDDKDLKPSIEGSMFLPSCGTP